MTRQRSGFDSFIEQILFWIFAVLLCELGAFA